MKKCFFIVCYFILASCQTFQRNPSSIPETAEAETLRELQDLTFKKQKIEFAYWLEQIRTKPVANPQEQYHQQVQQEKKESYYQGQLQTLSKKQEALIQATVWPESTVPQKIISYWREPWRNSSQVFEFKSMADYPLTSGRPQKSVPLHNRLTTKYEIEIKHHLFATDIQRSQKSNRTAISGLTHDFYLEAQLTCDKDFTISYPVYKKSFLRGSYAQFRFYDEGVYNNTKIIIDEPGLENCFLFLIHPKTGEKAGIAFAADAVHPPVDEFLHDQIQGCVLPSATSLQGIQKFFLTANYNSMTCPEAAEGLTSLPEAYQGLNAKVKALLGRELTLAEIESQNPYLKLDFSQAPQLDSIYISYLVFRADYYGTLISRLLEYHAQKGTRIKILVAKVVQLEKDKKLMQKMTSTYPNIEIIDYQYDAPAHAGLGDKFVQLHRTNHIKIFATYTHNKPENDILIIGGRNIHDGFLFRKINNREQYPDLVDYGNGADESWAVWRDYEVEIRGREIVSSVIAHYLNLWNRDTDTGIIPSINVNIPLSTPVDPNYFQSKTAKIRHFISNPYRDQQKLEQLFADMIDHAQKKIILSSPYLRPTPPLWKALERATERNVDITIMTRLNLKGDIADFVLGDANKQAVNSFLGKIKLREYTEPDVILHSKIILIDDEFSFVGGVNLNKRSFIHDLENGIMVYSPSYNKSMTQLMTHYMELSRPIEQKLKVRLIPKFVLWLFDSAF